MDTEFLFKGVVEVGTLRDLGTTQHGHRRIIDLAGGTFEGPEIKGQILPGGADWQLGLAGPSTRVEARYTLETDDGALIYVQSIGYRHGPEDVMKRIWAGEDVDHSSYYFRTCMTLETSSPKYEWMNHTLVVASAERHPDKVVLSVYKVK